MPEKFRFLLCTGIIFVLIVNVLSQDLGFQDVYTFCGKGRQRGDNSACLGYCDSSQTICSPETGICSCNPPANKVSSLIRNYNCKPARPKTRCHNACKTYSMINFKFRRGETKVCDSKTVANKKMCFCLPRP